MQKITTFLTFKHSGDSAIDFYLSVFKNSSKGNSMVVPETGQLLFGSFTLDGQEFMAMDGGDFFEFKEGTSLFVTCNDQEEVDYYWDRLCADGGEPGRCGWLKDKFGVSWQIIPKTLGELMSNGNATQSQRVHEAMMKMDKIDIKTLEKAFHST